MYRFLLVLGVAVVATISWAAEASATDAPIHGCIPERSAAALYGIGILVVGTRMRRRRRVETDMRNLLRLLSLAGLVLTLGLGSGTAHAIPVGTDQFLRADFDISALTPAGPYDFLGTTLTFDALFPNEVIETAIFDAEGQPPVGTLTTVNNFGVPINNISDKTPLSPAALADGVGFILFSFSQPIDVSGVHVSGFVGAIGRTPSSAASLSVVPVPEPSTTLLHLSALGVLAALAVRRRRAH